MSPGCSPEKMNEFGSPHREQSHNGNADAGDENPKTFMRLRAALSELDLMTAGLGRTLEGLQQ